MLTDRQRAWAEMIAAKPAARRTREEQRVLDAFRSIDRRDKVGSAARRFATSTTQGGRGAALAGPAGPTLWGHRG